MSEHRCLRDPCPECVERETVRSLGAALTLARELAAELVLKCGCPDHQAQVDMLDIELRVLRRGGIPFLRTGGGDDHAE